MGGDMGIVKQKMQSISKSIAFFVWCPGQDSNLHILTNTSP